MHILEQYSLSSGLKINKPYIYESFYPLPCQKYVTFHAPQKFDSRKYDYWQEVIYMITPYLSENNISIIQIGGQEEKNYFGVIRSNGTTTLNQTAYIIKNSMLHFGVDSFPIHIASYFDKKIVGLYSNMYKTHSGPYWGSKKNHILLESEKNDRKPSYSPLENPKTINTIYPEIIAKSILDLLNIKNNITVRSIFFGSNYSEDLVELIPNMGLNHPAINICNVRMDKLFNMECLQYLLSLGKKYNIFTDRYIDDKLIRAHSNKINCMNLLINDRFAKEEIFSLASCGVRINLFLDSSNQHKLGDLQLEYMDIGKINVLDNKDKKEILSDIINNKKYAKNKIVFKSSKIIFSNNKMYSSYYHLENNIPINATNEALELPTVNESFYKDLNHYYIYRLT